MRYTLQNKIKNLLVLLFIVIAMLLIIGSVNAVDSNKNITSADDSLCISNDDSCVNSNNEISNEIVTVDNDGNGINYDSEIEVSNSENKLGSPSSQDTLSATSFNIQKKCLTPVVKVGDDVYFEIFVQNSGWENYNDPNNWWDGVLTINDWFNQDELEYVDFTPNAWAQNYLEPQVSENYGHHLEFKYRVYSGWQPGSTLNFTVHFKAKKPGYFENAAHIWYNWQDYWGRANVLVGNPDLNITKTTSTPVVMLGDDVYFDIYVENNGTLPYVDNPLFINEWFDSKLIYVDCKPLPDKNGNSWDQNYQYMGMVQDPVYGDRLVVMYNTCGNWEPGSSLHFQVHFKANGTGQITNNVQVFWKWKDWGPDEVHEWVEKWSKSTVSIVNPEFILEKVAITKNVTVGDDVSFELTVTNIGKIDLTGVYIQDNEYSNGLKYSDYSDKSMWTFDGTDKWTYNEALAPGDSATLKLKFVATSAGVHNNTAICGNNLTNETVNSTDNVTVIENETEDEPEVPEGNSEDDSEDVPEDPEETPSESEVQMETSKPVSKNATGNPLIVLLLSLVAFGFIPLRNKKN